MYMEPIRGRYRLWARSAEQAKATLRYWGNYQPRLVSEGERLARASGDEGVMSVWIVDTRNGSIPWSAGEKYAELHATPQTNEE